MKAKVRYGDEHLHSSSYRFKDIKDKMIINFSDKYTYLSFRQKKNHLYIETTNGEIDIVFTGYVPQLVFRNYEKDQLVLLVY